MPVGHVEQRRELICRLLALFLHLSSLLDVVGTQTEEHKLQWLILVAPSCCEVLSKLHEVNQLGISVKIRVKVFEFEHRLAVAQIVLPVIILSHDITFPVLSV